MFYCQFLSNTLLGYGCESLQNDLKMLISLEVYGTKVEIIGFTSLQSIIFYKKKIEIS